MATITKRGPYQYQVKIRRKGGTDSRTFESYAEAENWAAIVEGKIRGDEFHDVKKARNTSLKEALDWYADRIAPKDEAGRRKPVSGHAKNKLSHIAYWKEAEFADWALTALRKANLIEWRRNVLDEDNRDDGEIEGPDAEVSAQTVIHRLNLISHLYNQWADYYEVPLTNPVQRSVRPSKPPSRTRRLQAHPSGDAEKHEETRLLNACAASESKWLEPMVRIAIETAMRQGELVKLVWANVNLDGRSVYLSKTKNGDERTVPLSSRAVAAFRMLLNDNVVPLGNRKVFPVESGRAVSHAFSKACAAADPALEDLHFHDLRHEATSRLFERTKLRDMEIAAITGHRSLSMLKRYAHLRSSAFAEMLG